MKDIITSKDNPNIKLYQKLSSSKKARKENNMFCLEGYRLISDAVKENLELYCVFLTKKASEKYSKALNLQNDETFNKIVYISDEIALKLSDTKTPQGVFAICKKLDKINYTDKILSSGKFIVLHNVQDPGNIGTIIRTADAVGVNGIILTGDNCDIYNPKLIRSTMGSIFRVKLYIENDFEKIIEIFNKNNVNSYAAVIDKNAISLTECNFTDNCVVVVGNEGNGLPKEISDLCTYKLTIKMQGNIDSLNAAMATGIILWEMLK